MRIYALIWEAHSDDDRLMGLYSSLETAQKAWKALLGSDDDYPYQFYRIECRELDAPGEQYTHEHIVDEHYKGE